MIRKHLLFSLFAIFISSCITNQNTSSGNSESGQNFEKKQITKYFLWSNGKFVENDSLKLDEISLNFYSKLKYPSYARQKGIEGVVILTLIIDQRGNLQSAKIKKDIGGGCGEAALKAIKQTFLNKPFFVKFRGEPVKAKMEMPVFFKLTG